MPHSIILQHFDVKHSIAVCLPPTPLLHILHNPSPLISWDFTFKNTSASLSEHECVRVCLCNICKYSPPPALQTTQPPLPEPRIKHHCHPLIQFWGACCLESSSEHESSSIEFRPCFQNYFMVNLSWTSLAVSTFWCSLWQKAPPFPDLLHWGGDVCWLLPYLSLPQRVRGAGRWAQRAGREGGWLSRLSHSPGCCTWGWWAPSLRAGSGEPTERDLPSAGSDQTPSGSTCTDTKQTPRAQVGCSLSSEFGLYSAAEVVKCYSHGGNKANPPLRKDCSNSLFWKSGDQQNISWNSFAHPQPVLTVCFAFSQLGRLALEQPCLALEVPFSLLWLRMIHICTTKLDLQLVLSQVLPQQGRSEHWNRWPSSLCSRDLKHQCHCAINPGPWSLPLLQLPAQS